jgi:hypothetical protein
MTTISTVTSVTPTYTPPAPAPVDNTPSDDTSGSANSAIYNDVSAASASTVRGVNLDITA